MNYTRIYEQLIDRSRDRVITGYIEKHHIVPRCCGGTDKPSNIVKLTPEEHYLAHQLLVKIHPSNTGLAQAAAMMIPSRPSNKMYGWLKKRHAVAMSVTQSGDKNSQFGTRWIHNVALKKSKKIKREVDLPDGWVEGRIVNFDRVVVIKIPRLKKPVKTIAETLKTKHFMFRKTVGYRNAKTIRLYAEFKNDNVSLRKFAKSKNMIPMTLSKWFREFIDEYSSK